VTEDPRHGGSPRPVHHEGETGGNLFALGHGNELHAAPLWNVDAPQQTAQAFNGAQALEFIKERPFAADVSQVCILIKNS
jgi:hypothetical protein